MIDFQESIRKLREEISGRIVSSERISLYDSLGRIAAEEALSRLHIPPFNRSAMDGFAVRQNDEREEYRIVETIKAGSVGRSELLPGTCVKIMTGAPVPEQAGRVIKVEDTEDNGKFMRVIRFSGDHNIAHRGEDIREGERILKHGELIDIASLPVLISCGIEEITVRRRVKVSVLCTGNELVKRMSDYRPGKIFDSNGPLLTNLFRIFGADVVVSDWIPDDLNESIKKIKHAISCSDVICLSGGVSAGDFDFVPEAMKASGLTIHFSRVRIKPGKPMTFASGNSVIALGFPGNPVSTFVMFHLYGMMTLMGLQGREIAARLLSLPLALDFRRKKAERTEFIPSRLDDRGRIKPMRYHGSGHHASLRNIDGFLVMAPGANFAAQNSPAQFWPLNVSPYEKV